MIAYQPNPKASKLLPNDNEEEDQGDSEKYFKLYTNFIHIFFFNFPFLHTTFKYSKVLLQLLQTKMTLILKTICFVSKYFFYKKTGLVF